MPPHPPTQPNRLVRVLTHPFSPSTTPLQATTYLGAISLFSISFLVFLNSGVSFVVTDLIGRRDRVGDAVGTLGFADEVVALVACPAWGLVSDRLGVRWVAVLGYAIVAAALVVFVQARNVYPDLLLARVFFALGATATATMVTAILPSLTDESTTLFPDSSNHKAVAALNSTTTSNSLVHPVASQPAAITPPEHDHHDHEPTPRSKTPTGRKPSVLAGYVGFSTGCGALVALSCFLPLPTKFSQIDGVTPGQAVAYSFYVVAGVAACVAVFVFFGLRGIRGEEGKGWRVLLGLDKKQQQAAAAHAIRSNSDADDDDNGLAASTGRNSTVPLLLLPYRRLLRDSIRLGFTDPHIALGYLGGFVARASTVAISLFIPLFVNTYFIRSGFCHGSPTDPSPDLKRECRSAYILASILSGVAQLVALLCAPLFGYLSSHAGRYNWPVIVATLSGVAGYLAFPTLSSPEYKDVDGRGGSARVFAVVALMGVSQIGAIVCSLGSLGKGVLAADVVPLIKVHLASDDEADDDVHDNDHNDHNDASERPLLRARGGGGAAATFRDETAERVSRVQLKGSIAGVYSWCGGIAILLLTKMGGYLFDTWSTGAPFYMMAVFNAALLVATLLIDGSRFMYHH